MQHALKVTKMVELFCYVRVSSRSQKDDGNSIDRRVALGKQVAKLKGLEYVEMLEGKEGVGSSKRYRPVFQDILSRIEELEKSNTPLVSR